MAILSPGSAFAEVIPVPCGAEDMLELHNPTVEEVERHPRRVGVLHPSALRGALFGCALQNEAVLEHLTREAIPPMRDLMWREYGMPDDDRAYRAALARMSDEQVTSTAADVYREHRY